MEKRSSVPVVVGAVVTGMTWAGDSCKPLSIILASCEGGGAY